METRYLFKAKRLDNGEWVQGCYIYDVDRDCSKSLNEFAHRIQPLYSHAYAEPVDPSTICQCTGLKDKNGKLIWENDIVKDDVIYGVVKWDDANARHIIDDRDDGYQEYSDWWHEVEVIGNVFDNQELLEE